MQVVTDRARKVRVYGVLAMRRHTRSLLGEYPAGELAISRAEFSFEMYWRASPELKSKVSVRHGVGREAGYRVRVEDGYGNLDERDNLVVINPVSDMELDSSAVGEYVVSMDVEEIYDAGLLAERDADGFPTEPLVDVDDADLLDGYGSAYPDGPPARGNIYRLRAKAGGELLVGVSIGGVSAQLRTIIPSSFVIEWTEDRAVWSLFSGAQGNVSPEAGYCRTQVEYHGFSVDDEYRRESGGTYIRANSNLFEVVNLSPNDGNVSKGFLTVIGSPPESYALDGRVRAFGSDFPVRMDARYFRKQRSGQVELGTLSMAPRATATVVQRLWICGGSIDEVMKSGVEISEKVGMRVFLDQRRLAVTGDDSRDWRVLLQGRRWPVFRVRHLRSTVLDSGNSLTGWSVSGGSIATLGAAIIFTPSSAGGVVTRTFSPEVNGEGYRYLRVRIRSVGTAGQEIRIGLAGQTWDVKTGASGEWVVRTLDLLCATSDTDTIKLRDTRFPIEDPGGYPSATLPTDPYDLGWGVAFIQAISFEDLPGTGTFEVDWIDFYRASTSAGFSTLAPFARRFAGWTSASDSTSLNQFWFGFVDGRTVDWPHLALITPFSGAPSYRWFSISELRGMVDYPSGWEADTTTIPAAPDAWHTSSLEAYFFHGGGSVFDYVTKNWTVFDRSVTETWQTVEAQMGWDYVRGYPGIGRGAWDGSDYDDDHPELPCAFTVHLRARAEGAVFKLSGKPNAGAGVNLKETLTPFTFGGEGVTDASGLYGTGSPCARGNRQQTTKLEVNPRPSDAGLLQNRERGRTSFRASQPFSRVFHSLERPPMGWSYTLASSPDGLLIVRYAIEVSETFLVDSRSVVAAAGAWIDGPESGIQVVFRVSGGTDIYEVRSDGREDVWGAATVIASGTEVALAHSRATGLSLMAYFDGTDWRSLVWGLGAGWISNSGTIVAAGEDTGGGLVHESLPLSRFRFTLVDGTDIRTFLSYDHGASWVEDES